MDSLSPSSSCSSLENLDPAERDAALTMCMIGGGREGSPGEPLSPASPTVCATVPLSFSWSGVCSVPRPQLLQESSRLYPSLVQRVSRQRICLACRHVIVASLFIIFTFFVTVCKS